MLNKQEFIYEAIKDTQSTIRAIDVKIGALLLIILAPFQSPGRVFNHIENLYHHSHQQELSLLVIVTFILSWGISFIVLIMGIGAIDNPSKHINYSSRQSGVFFSAGLYSFGIIDTILNQKGIRASKDVDNFIKDLPQNEEGVTEELSYEFMKLVYIREAKFNRYKWGSRVVVFWLVIGLVIYLSSKYL